MCQLKVFPKVLVALNITSPEILLNLDKTRWSWLTQLDKTIAAYHPVEYMKAMDRTSVMVWRSTTDTIEHNLFVIGRRENLLCLRCTKMKRKCGCVGYHDERTTVKLFNEWLEDFNHRMKNKHKPTVLCMENASKHRVTGAADMTLRQVEGLDVVSQLVTHSHIHVVYLLQNTSAN